MFAANYRMWNRRVNILFSRPQITVIMTQIYLYENKQKRTRVGTVLLHAHVVRAVALHQLGGTAGPPRRGIGHLVGGLTVFVFIDFLSIDLINLLIDLWTDWHGWWHLQFSSAPVAIRSPSSMDVFLMHSRATGSLTWKMKKFEFFDRTLKKSPHVLTGWKLFF